MRMRKNLTPLELEEHEKIAKWLLSFLGDYEACMNLVKKGFAETSPVVKKLVSMQEIGSWLKYSLQQGADLHNSKIERPVGFEITDDHKSRWSKVYLGDR
jgi:hypothetical protein